MARRLRFMPMLVLLALVSLAAPAHAIGAFGPPVTVYDPPCEFDAFNADAAQDVTGVAHGFTNLWGGTGCENPVIRYFEGSGPSWTQEATPYRGFVMGVAQDATGTYLLYLDPAAGQGIRITKRLAAGTYTAGRLLSGNWASSSDTHGDVVAAGGRWQAVWTEPTGAAMQLDLFQASTLGGTSRNRQRITTSGLADWGPTLALTPGTIFPLKLIWVRGGNLEGEGPAVQSDLRLANGAANGTWSASALATLGQDNFWPDARVVGTTTYVTWLRDGRAVAADDGSGRFASHTFATPAIPHGRPKTALSAGRVFAAWTTTSNRTFVAVRSGGTWTGAAASPAGAARLQFVTGLVPRNGKATALTISFGARLYATTES
jgi:hypothetical protein